MMMIMMMIVCYLSLVAQETVAANIRILQNAGWCVQITRNQRKAYQPLSQLVMDSIKRYRYNFIGPSASTI
jgi:hypothetical protein